MHSKTVVLYFFLLAVLVGGLKFLGINAGMQGILGAMAVAGVIIFVFRLIGRAIARKLARYGFTGSQWAAVAFGHSPDAIVVDAASSVEVAPMTMDLVRQPYDVHPVPYEYDDDDALPESIIEQVGLPLPATFQPSIQTPPRMSC